MARKTIWPGGTQLAPVPAALVGCGDGRDFKYNLITVAWAGTLASDPPTVGSGVRPERYSRGLIEATGEFTVNLPTAAMAEKVDYCGMVSGRKIDKFAACGFTPVPGSKVAAPVVEECPLTLECRLRRTVELGSHLLYLGEVLAVQVDSSLADAQGHFDIAGAGLLAYAHGGYYALGEKLGSFGFSLRKP